MFMIRSARLASSRLYATLIAAGDVHSLIYKMSVSRLYAIRSPPVMFCKITIVSVLRDQTAADDVRCPMYKLGVSRLYAIYIATADVHGPSSMFCGVSRLYAIYIAAVDVSRVDVQIDDARLYAICIAASALQCTMFEFHENSRLVAISKKNTSVS